MQRNPEAMGRIAQYLADVEGFPDTAEQVVELARTQLGASDAGVTLLRGSEVTTVGSTSERVRASDRAQNELGEGPCVDSATESRTVWSADLANDTRWPTWGPRAKALGFHSILSKELHVKGRRIGALNLYGDADAQFAVVDADMARVFTQHAVIALGHARRVDDLSHALSTRTLIGQAQGLLMAKHDLDADRSFTVLRRYSQAGNVKLRTVAEYVVQTRGQLPPPPHASTLLPRPDASSPCDQED